MKNVKGIYTFIEDEDNFKLCDYEIAILMISVMKWAKLYGPTKLYTNQKGFEYLSEIGIIDLWGEVDKELLEDISGLERITDTYKIKIMKNMELPFALLERDTYISEELGVGSEDFWESDLIFPYIEKNDKEEFPVTNFVYFNNEDVINEYIKKVDKLVKETSSLEIHESPEEIFKFNISLNFKLFKGFLENDKLKINYIFTDPLANSKPICDVTFPPSWPFTTIQDPLTGPIFFLSRGSRIQIRNKSRIYNSQKKEWVLEQDSRRVDLYEDVKKFMFLEEGKESIDLLEDIIDNEEVVDKTKWEKGNKWGQSVI